MVHKLKIEPNYLDNLITGKKRVEIRVNDRDYQRGDLLQFNDYRPSQIKEYLFEVTHIHSGLGMVHNYVALSVVLLSEEVKGD